MAMVKIFPALLLPVLTCLTDACPSRPKEIHVHAGAMVVLQCPCVGHKPRDDTTLLWASQGTHDMHVINNASSSEQTQMLIHGRSLVILIASVSHQGNYSCSLGNSSRPFWFRLTVDAAKSAESDDRNKYLVVCDTQESCTLTCPEVNILDLRALNISSFDGSVWRKEGKPLPNKGYFSIVDEKDQGDYTCTRSYLHNGHVYNRTFTVELSVQPKRKAGKSHILSPSKTQVFYVDLGSEVVIDCEAVLYSDFDEVFWLRDSSFVAQNKSFPVFYTYRTSEIDSEEIHATASLVFKEVSEEDLSRQYRCKLDSVSERSHFVTITLVNKAPPFSLLLTLSLVGILVLIAVVVVYVKFKIHITLWVRDAIGLHNSISDGKNYDAFFMGYESDAEAGLDRDTMQWLESVLEEKFGYSLCLCGRNVAPESADAEAVSGCMEQSRTMVLVPTPAGCGLSSAVVNDVYASLVERRHRVVVISPEATAAPTSGPLPQALELLGKAVDTVIWKGASSKSHDSSFIKQLCYYLSAPQHPPKDRLLP